MEILLSGFGSRGDVQPLIGLAQGLQHVGYTVRIAAGSNFRGWIEAAGVGFADIGVDIQALMNTSTAQSWVEDSSNNPMSEMRTMRSLMHDFAVPASKEMLDYCSGADVIVSSLLTVGIFDAIAQKLGQKHIFMLLQPMMNTSMGDSLIRPFIPGRTHAINRLAGFIQTNIMWSIFGEAINSVRTDTLHIPPMTRSQFRHVWNNTPLINGFSPLVSPHAPDWPDHVYTTGYWFYDKHPGWQPDSALQHFLQAGPPPVYLGFGSMSNRNPEATANIMIEALQKTGQRGIISKGWAALHSRDLPDSIFLLDSAPHDWLFPQMAGIVHHGGAGTTATALRAGVPSTIVPHMADQFYWGRRIYELGVGGKMIHRHKLNTDRLASAIQQMVSDQSMQRRTTELGAKIQREDGIGNAVAAFNDILKQPTAQTAISV